MHCPRTTEVIFAYFHEAEHLLTATVHVYPHSKVLNANCLYIKVNLCPTKTKTLPNCTLYNACMAITHVVALVHVGVHVHCAEHSKANTMCSRSYLECLSCFGSLRAPKIQSGGTDSYRRGIVPGLVVILTTGWLMILLNFHVPPYHLQ